jgi:hypothetical protein
MRPESKVVQGQPSWRLANDDVEAFVTGQGGHLGPITFDLRGRKLSPYSVAPWAEEPADPSLIPLLKVLRGDFFCLPFGGNGTAYRGERHPVHGETANAPWELEAVGSGKGQTSLHLSLETKVRPGRVDKSITLKDGHQAVYCRHLISGMSGPMSLGHHAMLKFPDRPGSGLISNSPFLHGQVFPQPAENPECKGYSLLKPGAEFRTLDKVPTITGETTSLAAYPARRGFEDIAMVLADPDLPFAWTAVSFPAERYVWFALKDPRILRGTVFWHSNGGRHYAPWNGRHVNVLGIEDVTAYFHMGVAESARPNLLTKKGLVTHLNLNHRKPLIVNYIMGIALTPKGFDRVANIQPNSARDTVTLTSVNGRKVTVPLDLAFLD